MRRAEKAGRERADSFIRFAQDSYRSEAVTDRIRRHLSERARPDFSKPHQLYNPSREEIGAHQLTGRALKAALEAYDRGYRARLTEALSTLTRKAES